MGLLSTMYRSKMFTLDDFTYNFRVFRVIHLLFHLDVITLEEYNAHVEYLDNIRPIGIMVDFDTCQVQGAPGETYQF
jgi:hypothetical protein